MTRPPTTELLAAALTEAGAPADMIAKARAGHYDDYRSELPFPCMQLVRDAHAAGLHDIAERAKAGEFDATAEEAEEWARSPEGRATFDAFGKPAGEARPTKTKPSHQTEAAYRPPAPPPPVECASEDASRDKGMVHAACDIAARAGAAAFDFNFRFGPGGASWWCQAILPGGVRVIEDGYPTPSAAAWALIVRIAHGARCRCGKIASLDPAGIHAGDKLLYSGDIWTAQQQASAGVCLWTLHRPDGDPHWHMVSACGLGKTVCDDD